MNRKNISEEKPQPLLSEENENDGLDEIPEWIKDELKENPDKIYQIAALRFNRMSIHEGPIPPPEILKQYQNVDVTFPERIFVMAEKQSTHRCNIEEKVILSNIKSERISQILSFIICLVSILGSIFLIYHDKSVGGFTVLIGSLATFVSVFIYGKYKQAKELESKDEDMSENKSEN